MEGDAARSVTEDRTRLRPHGLPAARTGSVAMGELDGVFPPDAVSRVVGARFDVGGPGSARDAGSAGRGHRTDEDCREGNRAKILQKSAGFFFEKHLTGDERMYLAHFRLKKTRSKRMFALPKAGA